MECVMAAVSEHTSTDICPIREGDRFREGRSTLTVVEVITVDGTTFCRIESEHPTLGTTAYRMPRSDARERVRRGCWSRLDH